MDVIVDLQYGDCGKGKVAHFLCQNEKYTHVLRYNGGCNAGHTIFHKGKKFITHHIPAGVFFGVRSIIGSGCVLDPKQFFREIKILEDGGVSTKGKIFIAENTHVITNAHKGEDKQKGGKIGTTGRGNGPAYRDKYGRTGVRARDVKRLKPYLVNLYKEWYTPARPLRSRRVKILAEGAQGFGLDIDWGDYPYVTSSHCTTAGALLNGLPPSSIRNVWGVAKIYETYVGSKKFQPKGEVFDKIGDAGEEYGATTGRRRQCNWMNMQTLERAIQMNGVTDIVFNKIDVLRTIGEWAVIDKNKVVPFKTEKAMKDFVSKRLKTLGLSPRRIHFSESKENI
ncbi:MAG: Adenylosuccinate synthetase [Parcubacteria group bacterium GW2011_GWA2_51_10]|nr:MAG: Adenylosuccinate synthetase [Parcubacteria group bacterium GW2011_GWA2_51_10]